MVSDRILESPPGWQDQLVFDPDVSETSPIVKGTKITVNTVVDLVLNGLTWSDIMRSHPDLTAENIRDCLAYTVTKNQHGEQCPPTPTA